MKTKEQIEKQISNEKHPLSIHVVDATKLAAYLATIEERLEKKLEMTDISSGSPTPTEVKDWEVRFEEEFEQYRYEFVPKDMDVPVEKVKSFIRNLLK
jgi:hypothetical protein